MICLLDLDGTLIDSAERHAALMLFLLQERYGEPKGFDRETYMRYKADGHSGKQYLTQVLGLEEAQAAALQKRWTAQIEAEQYLQKDVLYPDAIPFLQWLEACGYQTVYLTARQDAEALHRELGRLGISRYAAQVIVADPADAAKEKISAAKELRKEDAQMWIVGDTENEFRMARALDVPAWLLYRGFRSRRYWEEKKIESYADLDAVRRDMETLRGARKQPGV
ncbi:MAG: HAD family hydrolase [Lachnospiraceae bacterium]|nr:HAD family hydrolase [Lachnospiraceae bacterium]